RRAREASDRCDASRDAQPHRHPVHRSRHRARGARAARGSRSHRRARRGNRGQAVKQRPDDTIHEPLRINRDAPITVTGIAAEEVRRLARYYGGPAQETAVAKLGAACVLRGLALVEAELAATGKPNYERAATRANDDEESSHE